MGMNDEFNLEEEIRLAVLAEACNRRGMDCAKIMEQERFANNDEYVAGIEKMTAFANECNFPMWLTQYAHASIIAQSIVVTTSLGPPTATDIAARTAAFMALLQSHITQYYEEDRQARESTKQ